MEAKHLLSAVGDWEEIRPHERRWNIPVSVLLKMAAWSLWTTCMSKASTCNPGSLIPSPLQVLHSLGFSVRLQCRYVLRGAAHFQHNFILCNSYFFIKQNVLSRTRSLTHLWLLPFSHFQLFHHQFYASFKNAVRLGLTLAPLQLNPGVSFLPWPAHHSYSWSFSCRWYYFSLLTRSRLNF